MERTLSLILDEEGRVSLTLMKDKADNIDKFTTKFEDSEMIRKKFKKQIEQYLKENKEYVQAISKKRGQLFRGRIAILEATIRNDSLCLVEKRVLYKKHLVAFNTIIKDKPTMLRFLQLEQIGYNQYGFKKLISPFLTREIRYANYKVVSSINLIKREIKRENFYDILRIICKAYEIERKKRSDLKTIEAIYKENITKPNNNLPREVSDFSQQEKDEEPFCIIDGVSYPTDQQPFDNDDLRHMDSTYIPDGLGGKDAKRVR